MFAIRAGLFSSKPQTPKPVLKTTSLEMQLTSLNQKQGAFDALLRLVALSLLFQVALALPTKPVPSKGTSKAPAKAGSSKATPSGSTPSKPATPSKGATPAKGAAAKPTTSKGPKSPPKGAPPKSSLPADVTRLAFDRDTGEISAYKKDGKLFKKFAKGQAKREIMEELMKRDGSTCTPLSADDAKKLPGFQKIDQFFHSTYGPGEAQVVTNPDQFPGAGATLCVDTNAIPVALQGQPTCNSAQSQINGQVIGTKGQVQVQVSQGYNNEGNWHVDQTSTIGVGTEFHVSLSIPEIADVGGSVTTETSFSNAISRGFSTSVNTVQTQQLTIDNPPGKQCHAEITTKTCTVGGKAQVPVIASGWVWYFFKDKVSPAGQNDYHWDWAQTIESVLTDVADRSSTITVSGNMNAASKSGYKAVCT